VVEGVSADEVTIMQDDGIRRTYLIAKFQRSNQGTCSTRSPSSPAGSGSRQPGYRGRSVHRHGEMALRKNLLVAFMSWEGHKLRGPIILSQRLVQDDVLSSIHIEEHEVDARDTKLGS